MGWRLRFRPSEQLTAWRRGAQGERRTARLLDRLTGDGYVVFHDLAVPGSPANVDHLVIGPSGVFGIDSKQWSGSVRQSPDGLASHDHYRLDRTLETVRWQVVGRLLGTRAAALVCVHGAYVHGGGLEVQEWRSCPPTCCAARLAITECCQIPTGAARRHRLDQPAPGRLTCPAPRTATSGPTGARPPALTACTPLPSAGPGHRHHGVMR